MLFSSRNFSCIALISSFSFSRTPVIYMLDLLDWFIVFLSECISQLYIPIILYWTLIFFYSCFNFQKLFFLWISFHRAFCSYFRNIFSSITSLKILNTFFLKNEAFFFSCFICLVWAPFPHLVFYYKEFSQISHDLYCWFTKIMTGNTMSEWGLWFGGLRCRIIWCGSGHFIESICKFFSLD